MKTPYPENLRARAEALRAQALADMARNAAIEWRSFTDLLRKRRPPQAGPHAPHPC